MLSRGVESLIVAAALSGLAWAGVATEAAGADSRSSSHETGDDERPDFEASFYTGLAIDTFAAGELGRYLNPDESSALKERFIGGFDFSYRLTAGRGTHQLWLYGQTVYGVRSTDVDCKAHPNLAVCKPFELPLPDAGERTLFILRNATSLEGFVGLRWEFATLHRGHDATAKPYLKAQAGFLAVSGGSGDLLDTHHFGLGLFAAKGRFEHSFLEVGIGTNDAFREHRRPRLYIEGLLSWKVKDFEGIRPFARVTIDSDLGGGSDALQTYLGVHFDLSHLFGKSGTGAIAGKP